MVFKIISSQPKMGRDIPLTVQSVVQMGIPEAVERSKIFIDLLRETVVRHGLAEAGESVKIDRKVSLWLEMYVGVYLEHMAIISDPKYFTVDNIRRHGFSSQEMAETHAQEKIEYSKYIVPLQSVMIALKNVGINTSDKSEQTTFLNGIVPIVFPHIARYNISSRD